MKYESIIGMITEVAAPRREPEEEVLDINELLATEPGLLGS